MMNESAQRYELVSIKRVEPPSGAEGSTWCRYVITQGKNTIRGYRQGGLKTVQGAVRQIVKQLNERQSGKRSVAAPKKKTTTKH